jgi:hypothetical protein
MQFRDEGEWLPDRDRSDVRGRGRVNHPGQQVERAGEMPARIPEDLLDVGIGIADEIGEQRQRLGRASQIVQNPPCRHAERGGSVGGDQ